MDLKKYYNKTVIVINSNDQIFSGVISDYFFPDDNTSMKESIVLETNSGDLYEFTWDDIKSIKEE